MPKEYKTIDDGLTLMLEAQIKLVKHYIKIQALPKYPMDLKQKSTQAHLKKMTGWIAEELTEAHDNLDELVALSNLTDFQFGEDYTKKANECREKYMMELGDVTHFFLELLIYSGWHDPYEVHEKILTQSNGADPLHYLFNEARVENARSGLIPPTRGARYTPVDKKYQQAVMHISQDIVDCHSEFLWALIKRMYRSCNILKNREWRQEDIKSFNQMEFKESVLENFYFFIRYCSFAEIHTEAFFSAFMMANDKNNSRIQNGY